jgi:peptidoglycan/xylan/chitin deacetylase (PgdA/CDA1 family)
MLKKWLIGKTPIVIMYHSIGHPGGFSNISEKRFEEHVRWISRNCKVVETDDILPISGNKKKVALTFDDGLSSFYENAIPIIKKYNVPATLFILSEMVKKNTKTKTERIIKKRLSTPEEIMGREEIFEIKKEKIITIGSHTATHPKLPKLESEKDVIEEVKGSKVDIENEMDVDITCFSYPHSKYDVRSHRAVSEVYLNAVRGGGETSVIDSDTRPCLIPRIDGARSLNHLKATIFDAVRTNNRIFQRWVD